MKLKTLIIGIGATLGIGMLIFSSCIYQRQQEDTVICPGEIWRDNNGEHINAHGGGILFHEGRYYWFGEHKSATTSSALVGVTCYSSDNLIDWKNEGVALPVSEDTLSDIRKGCIIERPKVIYNKKTDKFVMWFHLELKDKGYRASRAAVAVSNKVTGPYTYLASGRVNARKYPFNMTDIDRNTGYDVENLKKKWWTPEWQAALKQGLFVKRDFEGGQMSRDMTLFVDDNEVAYHIYSSEDNLTLHIAELSDDYQRHTGKYMRIFPGGNNEAPALFKKDNTYWLITSGCTGWTPNEARMFFAPSIWGPWTQCSTPCVGEDAHITFGGQSTYVLPVEGYKDKFIFMADIWRPKNPIDARYIWLPVRFDATGMPIIEWADQWNLQNYLNNKMNL